MFIGELTRFLKNQNHEIHPLEMTGNNSSCILLKSGLAEKSGSRNKVQSYHISFYSRGIQFEETYNRAEKLYREMHFPGVLKTIILDSFKIFSSVCLSMPVYMGKDKLDRHFFIFDAYAKAYKTIQDSV